jgi:hypothetical protein
MRPKALNRDQITTGEGSGMTVPLIRIPRLRLKEENLEAIGKVVFTFTKGNEMSVAMKRFPIAVGAAIGIHATLVPALKTRKYVPGWRTWFTVADTKAPSLGMFPGMRRLKLERRSEGAADIPILDARSMVIVSPARPPR